MSEHYRCTNGHIIRTAGVPVRWCPACGMACEKMVRLGDRQAADEPQVIDEPRQ